MEFHEVADIFPLLVGDDYERFKADIASNGQLEPIWVYDNKIIDGRNRYRACVDLGIEPKYQQAEELNISLVELVVSLNVARRQLATGQLAACAVEALPPLEEEAKERRVEIGKATGRGNLKVAAILPEPLTGEAREKAAELFGVSARYIQYAKRIKTEAPDIFAQLKAGWFTLPQAKRELRRKTDNDQVFDYTIDDNDLYENFKELTWAVICRAVCDAADWKDAAEPRRWLRGDDCRWYCERLGIAHDLLVDWVDTGCKITPLHIQLLNVLGNQRT